MKQVLSILLLICFISYFPIIAVHASSVRFGIEIEPSDGEPSPTARTLSNGSGGGGGSVGNPSQQNQTSHSEIPATKNDFPTMEEEAQLRIKEGDIKNVEMEEVMEPAESPSFISVDPRSQSSVRTNEDRSIQGEPTVNVSTLDTRMTDRQKNTGTDQTREILAEQNQIALAENHPSPTSILAKMTLAVAKEALERIINIGLFFQAKVEEVLKFVSWLFS